jgi:D-alanyl-D-alanine carboxypeptidase/D-alanyl-D-alanine-endopeptidase (penicillin-binding protein 4)
MAKGVQVMEECLENLGIPRNSYSIHDGSGLTRETRVTARQMLKVLLAAYNDFGMSPEFLASMGIAGEDGTIRNRFGASTLTGLLRAKTGTLDGVSALAGFAPAVDGELIAFVILINDPRMRFGHMSGWADQVAVALSKYTRK